ncbi:hypothetical protein NXS19_010191 [Fusarium pseudograminearum]|uniref:Uncharacterized protein n=1 Tax=Fusarium pseudograminearum (strain CS3096) TaxID=1028729 RepID=K3VSJ6_FUSPC|nr:hypothetical protein FPSE_01170 [Fusarium pseudograminearum CS3096]EKJ78682.1 hypothetical protein FPSE_01170 [Fusarium pseudograminearum CS3096]UZP42375.1 hypothetical protein NXS19_010191 [Fusarium pseudograminearum]
MTDLPPRDPSLETRPIPDKRFFDVCSFGPGADLAIQRTARSVNDLDLLARPSDFSDNPESCIQWFERERHCIAGVRHDEDWLSWSKRSDVVRKILSHIQTHQNNTSSSPGSDSTDPTWGYYVFVTSYTESAQELEAAVEVLVQLTLRNLRHLSPSLYSEEASKRFKLNVIQNREALEDASEDRVREEFRAQLRGLGMREGDIMSRVTGSSRSSACILLDGCTISQLSCISLPLDEEQDEIDNDVYVKMIDPKWDYPIQPYPDTVKGGAPYLGEYECPAEYLAKLYLIMEGDMTKVYPMWHDLTN